MYACELVLWQMLPYGYPFGVQQGTVKVDGICGRNIFASGSLPVKPVACKTCTLMLLECTQ